MTISIQAIISVFDRVQRLEPHLRISLAAVRETAYQAINDVWMNYSWASGDDIEGDHDFQVWSAVHAAQRVLTKQFDDVVVSLIENLQNQASLDSEVEDSERRELSMQLYGHYETLQKQLKQLVHQRDIDAATVDAANLSCARVLAVKVAPLKKPRLKQIAKSAIDSALAASLLARRVAVVKDQPPTMGDAELQ